MTKNDDIAYGVASGLILLSAFLLYGFCEKAAEGKDGVKILE